MSRLKVLIPLDGSKLAEASLSYLSSLRALGEVDLMLLSVADESEEVGTLATDEAREREHNVLASYLRDVAGDIKKHLGLPSETRIVSGSPAESILSAAADFQPDLILISTHGRSGISRWRLGSVADKVIRGASGNLLVMGPKAAETAEWFAEISPPFQSVLLTLDGSALPEEAIPIAQRFADSYGSTLHVVRVVPIPMYGNMSGEAMYPNLLTDLVTAAEQYVASVLARPGMPADCKSKVPVGSPASELLTYVEDNHIDLIIMTTHGRGGISRAALGSVTDRLLGSPAPVLVVRPSETAGAS